MCWVSAMPAGRRRQQRRQLWQRQPLWWQSCAGGLLLSVGVAGSCAGARIQPPLLCFHPAHPPTALPHTHSLCFIPITPPSHPRAAAPRTTTHTAAAAAHALGRLASTDDPSLEQAIVAAGGAVALAECMCANATRGFPDTILPALLLSDRLPSCAAQLAAMPLLPHNLLAALCTRGSGHQRWLATALLARLAVEGPRTAAAIVAAGAVRAPMAVLDPRPPHAHWVYQVACLAQAQARQGQAGAMRAGGVHRALRPLAASADGFVCHTAADALQGLLQRPDAAVPGGSSSTVAAAAAAAAAPAGTGAAPAPRLPRLRSHERPAPLRRLRHGAPLRRGLQPSALEGAPLRAPAPAGGAGTAGSGYSACGREFSRPPLLWTVACKEATEANVARRAMQHAGQHAVLQAAAAEVGAMVMHERWRCIARLRLIFIVRQ